MADYRMYNCPPFIDISWIDNLTTPKDFGMAYNGSSKKKQNSIKRKRKKH